MHSKNQNTMQKQKKSNSLVQVGVCAVCADISFCVS